MQRIVIVGAGQAGAQAAATLRAEGYRGALMMIGAEPSLPYERPPLSKAYLKGEVDAARLALRSAAFYAEKGIETLTGRRVTAVDRAARRVSLDAGVELGYDRLLLATGSHVRRLSLPGIDLPGVHYLRSLDDADALRGRLDAGSRLVVVGGGYIGLEVAATAQQLGCRVSVLEAMSRLMARVAAPEISAAFADRHCEAGIDLRLGCGVAALEGRERVEAVTLADGRSLPADAVVVGVGVLPALELAQEAGLAVGNGICVDARGASSDPCIFAAGDVACRQIDGMPCRLESVPNAIGQGRTAAFGMLDRDVPPAEVPWFWSEQFEFRLQIAGLARPEDSRIVRRYEGGGMAVCHLRDGRVAAVETLNRPADFMSARKLIARGIAVDPDRLADAGTPLKGLL